MPSKPEILASETVAESHLFRIERLDLRFSNGVERQYERLLSGSRGAVLVVPLLGREVVLIREYAAGTDRYELAFPKGLIEAGEEPLEAANRELMEEIGMGAKRLSLLRTMSIAPGYFAHQTHLVLAEALFEASAEGDEPEPVEVVRWPLDDIDDLLARDDFTEARSIAALLLIQHKVNP
jgi:ADP-ribose diphosphatase